MNNISDKAVVSPKAKLGDNIKIFPFVYIEDYVEIGDNCVIFPFVSILNSTRLGKNNKVHQGSVLGALPQDFAFKGERSEVVVGDNNVATAEGWREGLADPSGEGETVDRSVDDAGRDDAVVAQASEEGERLPVAVRYLGQ